jgi:hypothetical protein
MRISLLLLSVLTLVPVGVAGRPLQAHANAFTNNTQQENLLQPIVIDFDEFAAGYYLRGDEWAEYGLSISVNSNRQRKDGSGDLPLRLYNSDCEKRPKRGSSLPKCEGGDSDLATGAAYGTDPQGNVLIIQEDNSKRKNRNDLGDPDDDARGGTISFNFAKAVSLFSFGFLDFDDKDRGEGYLRVYTGKDDTEAAITFNLSDTSYLVNPDYEGDNSLRIFQGFGDSLFHRIEVEYPGSGAVTQLEFQVAPETTVAPGGSANWLEDPESRYW